MIIENFGNSVPDVFLGNISLVPHPLADSNQFLDYRAGTERQNYSSQMSVNLQIVVKLAESSANNMDFLEKYFKIFIVQCGSQNLFEILYAGPSDFCKKMMLAGHAAATNNRALDVLDFNNHAIPYQVVDFKSSLNVDYEARKDLKFKNFYFYKTFLLDSVAPSHLSYFLIPFFDRASYNQSQRTSAFELKILKDTRARKIYSEMRNVAYNFGKISSEVVVAEGLVPEAIAYYHRDSNQAVYKGPMYFGKDKAFHIGSRPSNTSHGEVLYTTRNYPNIKVVDYRIIEEMKKWDLDFKKPKDDMLDPRRQYIPGIGTSKKIQFFSDGGMQHPQYSRLGNGALSFMVHFNLEALLKTHSEHSGLYRRNTVLKQTLISHAKIKNIKFFRRRVRDSFDRMNFKNSTSHFDENNYNGDDLVAESVDIAKGRGNNQIHFLEKREFGSRNKIVGQIREHSIDFNISNVKDKSLIGWQKAIRTFEITDYSFADLTAGKYTYIIEVEIEDRAIEVFRSLYFAMRTTAANLRKLIETVENNKSYYNSASDRFTNKYINFWKRSFGRAREAMKRLGDSDYRSPEYKAVYDYLKFMSFFYTDKEISNEKIGTLLKIVSPKHGSLRGLRSVLGLVESLLGRLDKKYKFKSFDEVVFSNVYDYDNNDKKIIKITSTLDNAIDASVPRGVGSVYFGKFIKSKMPTGVPVLKNSDIQNEASRTRDKYFNANNVGDSSSPYLTPGWLSTTNGSVINLARADKKTYMPQVMKFNLDRELNASFQPTFNYNSSTNKKQKGKISDVNSAAYALVNNAILPYRFGAVVEQISTERLKENSLVNSGRRNLNKNLTALGTGDGRLNVGNNEQDALISSDLYLGNPNTNVFGAACEDRQAEKIKDISLLKGMESYPNFDQVLDFNMSVMQGNKKEHYAEREVSFLAAASTNGPMRTLLDPPSSVKKVWDPNDASDKIKIIRYFKGFQKNEEGEFIINRQIWAPLTAERRELLAGSRLLCRLDDAELNRDASMFADSYYPVIGETFVLDLSGRGAERKRELFRRQSIVQKIETVANTYDVPRCRTEYFTSSPNQAQVKAYAPLVKKKRYLTKSTISIEQAANRNNIPSPEPMPRSGAQSGTGRRGAPMPPSGTPGSGGGTGGGGGGGY